MRFILCGYRRAVNAAGIAFVLGLLRIALGLAAATGTIVEPEPGHYLDASTSGEAIDQGIYYLLFAIILDVVTDISRSVAKGNQLAGSSGTSV